LKLKGFDQFANEGTSLNEPSLSAAEHATAMGFDIQAAKWHNGHFFVQLDLKQTKFRCFAHVIVSIEVPEKSSQLFMNAFTFIYDT
jgi:hypothetical protein